MKINDSIRSLRLKMHMSQEKLGEKLGVSAQAVSKWEQGTTSPDISLLPEIAGVFGVTIDSMFHGAPTRRFTGYGGEPGELYAKYTSEGGTDEDFKKASDAYSEIILSGKAAAKEYLRYGILYRVRAARDAETALYYYQRAISEGNERRDLDWMAAHQTLTNLLYDLGRIEEAVEIHRKWRNKEPETAWAHVSYAYALEKSGKLNEAWEEISEALRLDEDDLNVRTAAGDLCAKLGRFNEAVIHWDKAHELDSGSISHLFSKAEMFASIGENEKAVMQFEEIIDWLEEHGYNMELEGAYPKRRIEELSGK